jgi:hypothetical protein
VLTKLLYSSRNRNKCNLSKSFGTFLRIVTENILILKENSLDILSSNHLLYERGLHALRDLINMNRLQI